MLADDIISDTDLPQACVHVRDERLGEERRVLTARFALTLEAKQSEGGHGGDHVESAIDRIGHLSCPVPFGIAGSRDDRAIERIQLLTPPRAFEKSLQEGQGVPRRSWTQKMCGLRRLGDVHIGRASQARPLAREPGDREFESDESFDRTTRHAGYLVSQQKRKLIEEVFGWLKTVGLMRKLRHRGTRRVDWLFTFATAVYNLVRILNLLEPAA